METLNFAGRNKIFLRSYGKFCITVYNKYFEFFKDISLTVKEWDGLMEIYMITFTTKIPKKISGTKEILNYPEGSIYYDQHKKI